MEQRVHKDTGAGDEPLRLYLVEDSPRIIEHLIAMFDSIDGVLTVGCARTADDAVRGIRSARPQVIVLDIQLARGSGFTVLRSIRDIAPEAEVFVLSNFAAEPYRRLATRLGARGFFDKSTEFEDMRRLISARASQAGKQHPNPSSPGN
jgi:DNA-binding NarL/FixJ family response regulator